MNNIIFRTLFLVFTLISFTGFSQSKVTLSGYLKDAQTGEGLFGATVYIAEIKSGTTTNLYGYYAISLPKGTYSVTYNYLGYVSVDKEVNLDRDKVVSIEMQSDQKLLDAVEITAEKANENVTSMDIGMEKMDAKTIKGIPQFMRSEEHTSELQ